MIVKIQAKWRGKGKGDLAMVKVGSFYCNGAGKIFDMKYYCEIFVPLLKELFGDELKGVAVDQGLYGGEPDAEPFFFALGQYFFDTEEQAVTAYFSNLERIQAERPKFTNIEPVVQVSQVILNSYLDIKPNF
jgi:uncharacterized protein (TIGR02118 family)